MSLLPFLLTATAGALAGASLVSFTSSGMNYAMRRRLLRRQFQLDHERLQHEAEVIRLRCELNGQSQNGPGAGWKLLEVTEIVDESADCRSFYFRDSTGEPLPGFVPGQFVMVRPSLGGSSAPTRCYSLSDSPNRQWWRISVKRQNVNSGGARNKASLSNWLHDHVRVGDCLLGKGPAGAFVLDQEHTGPLVLLAAGIGITPMLSMLRWALERDQNRPTYLFFQAQDEDHWPFGAQIHEWQTYCPGLQVHTYFSRQAELPDGVAGSIQAGKFGAAEILQAISNKNASNESEGPKFYMCGPNEWMKSLRESLWQAEVPQGDVYWESFGGPSSDSKAKSVAAITASVGTEAQPTEAGNDGLQATTADCTVRFSVSDVEVQVTDPESTVWEIAKENGLELPSGCHSGACGSCKLRLVRGKVSYSVPPTFEVGASECLTCVARPQGNVEIEG